jgi:hypothetical protein
VRQQLTYHAIRFEEFADELELRENQLMPLSAAGDDSGHA